MRSVLSGILFLVVGTIASHPAHAQAHLKKGSATIESGVKTVKPTNSDKHKSKLERFEKKPSVPVKVPRRSAKRPVKPPKKAKTVRPQPKPRTRTPMPSRAKVRPTDSRPRERAKEVTPRVQVATDKSRSLEKKKKEFVGLYRQKMGDSKPPPKKPPIRMIFTKKPAPKKPDVVKVTKDSVGADSVNTDGAKKQESIKKEQKVSKEAARVVVERKKAVAEDLRRKEEVIAREQAQKRAVEAQKKAEEAKKKSEEAKKKEEEAKKKKEEEAKKKPPPKKP